ncbi:MAG: esterase, partial [Mesorhizobium sp.]
YTGWITSTKAGAWETLLTKRIHPTHHFDTGIIEIRPLVGDLANGA